MSSSESEASITLEDGDLSESVQSRARSCRRIAWDTETSGLDWRTERLALCQLYSDAIGVHVVRIGKLRPSRLCQLLEDEAVEKIFHYALFDLRFMASAWGIRPRNVRCTKVASKILSPSREEHSLKSLVGEFLGLQLDKAERTSDWFAPSLTQAQLAYAARDVLYLPSLFDALESQLARAERWPVALEAFRFLPIQLQLDLWGCTGVFDY